MQKTLVRSTTWYHGELSILENHKPNPKSVGFTELQSKKLEARLEGTYIPNKVSNEIGQLITESLNRKRNFVKNEMIVKVLDKEHFANNFIKQMENKIGGYENIPKPKKLNNGKYLVAIQIK